MATEAQSQTPPVNFDMRGFLRVAYQSAATMDAEKRVKIAAAENKALMPAEEFYAKFIGIGLVGYLHDVVWAYIWKSQFLMLLELNKRGGLMPLAEVRTFYDLGAQNYPQNYSSYTFDEWLNFVCVHNLAIRHPSDMVEITILGRDFITYSAHNSRTPDQRKG